MVDCNDAIKILSGYYHASYRDSLCYPYHSNNTKQINIVYHNKNLSIDFLTSSVVSPSATLESEKLDSTSRGIGTASRGEDAAMLFEFSTGGNSDDTSEPHISLVGTLADIVENRQSFETISRIAVMKTNSILASFNFATF